MEPTKRAVVDIGRKCNVNCKFCYYSHLGDLRKQSFRPLNELIEEVKNAKLRGNTWIDITGGEPTIYPQLSDLVKAIHNEKMKACIITNGIMSEVESILGTGVDEFLFSIHGTESIHDSLLQRNGAREQQLKFIDRIQEEGIPFRFNTVINSYTYEHLSEMVNDFRVSGMLPYIWNFINFNPHHEWSQDIEATKSIIVTNFKKVSEQIAIVSQMLEVLGVGVNLRYFPMCQIPEVYRRIVCNDLHVTFDPYEWDYNIFPKTGEAHLKWAITGSANVELKTFPCSYCQLQYICGGVNRAFYQAYKALGHDDFKPISREEFSGSDPFDFYYYRKYNVLTLEEQS